MGRGAAPDMQRRLAAIDVLRGVAVTLVVLTHLKFSWSTGAEAGPPTTPPWWDATTFYGRYGVHLFLVISGFCIHMQWARSADLTRGVSFGGFWARRLRRLYPPYFVALLFTLAGLFVVHRLLGHAADFAGWFGYASTTQLAIDLVLLVVLAQNLTDAPVRIGNAPFWSLALEEQLYALYFPLLWLRRKLGWGVLLGITATTTLVFRALTPWMHWENAVNFGLARWLEWSLGAYAVEAHLGKAPLPRWLSHPATFVAVLAAAIANVPPPGGWTPLPFGFVFEDALFGVAFFVMVNWFCRLDREGKLAGNVVVDVVRRLGLVSYSVYLVHEPILIMVRRVAILAGLHSVALVLVVRFVAAMVGGTLFYWVVERRFLHASRPSAQPASAPATVPAPPG